MQLVETELTVGGLKLTQIAREGEWAVYEQTKAGKVYSYELVHIQIHRARTIFDKEYPEREVYPGNEKWGVDGFTLRNRDEAIHRMHEISLRRPSRKPTSGISGVR